MTAGPTRLLPYCLSPIFSVVSVAGDPGPARHGGPSGLPHRGPGARGQHRVQGREPGPPGHPGPETLRQREAPQQRGGRNGGLRMLPVRGKHSKYNKQLIFAPARLSVY